ncbi:MAG: hypothetical protein ABI693_18005 [Bryobacteraceae bacterium]
MRSLSVARARAASLLTIFLLGAAIAGAKDGRDFAGFYSLSDVTETGDRIQVTLQLQLFNYSGMPLENVAVALNSAQPESAAIARFAPIKLWPSGKDVMLIRTIMVPRAMFDRWRGHTHPNIFIGYHDSDGQALQQTVQLNQRAQLP